MSHSIRAWVVAVCAVSAILTGHAPADAARDPTIAPTPTAAGNSGTAGAPTGLVHTRVGLIQIGANFTGSTLDQSGFIPPDTMGAVGPNHIMELINGRAAFYTKDGTFLSGKSLNAFWEDGGVSPAGSFAFDPRVLYDASSQRFFATAVDNHSGANNFLLAVSNSSDPTADWTAFQIDSDSDNAEWADFPTLGVTADRVTVTALMFPTSGGGTNISVLTMPKADLLAATPTVANRTLFENISPNVTGFTPQPVVDPDNAGSQKLLSSFNKPSGFLKTSTITGTAASPSLSTSGGFISVTGRTTPPDIDQPGGKANIDAGDSRFAGNVVQQHIAGRTNPSLFGVHGVNINSRAAIEWYEIDALTNAVRQSGTITDPSLGFNFPSIAVNDAGDIVIGFSGGDPSTYISSYVVVGRTDGGTTTLSDPIVVKAGVDDYQRLAGSNRWGDYSATVLDPSDPTAKTFWTFQEFVSADDTWSVQITEVIVPEPGTASLAVVGGLLVILVRRRRSRRVGGEVLARPN